MKFTVIFLLTFFVISCSSIDSNRMDRVEIYAEKLWANIEAGNNVSSHFDEEYFTRSQIIELLDRMKDCGFKKSNGKLIHTKEIFDQETKKKYYELQYEFDLRCGVLIIYLVYDSSGSETIKGLHVEEKH